MPDRDYGQHAFDEMGSRVSHAATAAGGTEAAALAADRDEAIVAAGVAVDPDESMGKEAAREIGPDLALDEAGDGRAGGPSPIEKGDELRADDFVQEGLLGLVTNVVGDGEASGGTGAWGRGDRPSGRRRAES